MATKIHVGFRDGKLTSGKCEADKGKCPYGNHFASQSEADKYQEDVAAILYSPAYRHLTESYEVFGAEGGKLTTAQALGQGFPPEIAKLIGGEPTDPKYARENVGKDVTSDSATDELVVEEPAPNVTEDKKESTPVDHTRKPKGIDLDTDEGVARFKEILDSYRVSSSEEFKQPPSRLRRLIRLIDPRRKSKLTEEYKTFGSVLTALRTGQIIGLKKNEHDQLNDILMHQSRYRISAMKKYRELGKSNPDDTLFRSIASYGEVGNDANDLITLTTLARRAAGVNEDDDFAGYEAADADLIHNDGVAGEEDWNRVVGKVGIPYGAATEMGYDPDIELNKIRHMKLANSYSDMLADSRAKKKIAHAAMDGLTVGEILAKVDAPNQRHSSQHPIYAGHSEAWGDKYLQENYYKEASEETKAKLKPGAFMMLNGRDAEVYQIREDGALMTPESKVWGHVDFKTGRVHNAYGENIFVSQQGARVYANKEELLRFAALDDVEEMPAGGIVGATSSSDPGYRSRYEDDPKLSKKFDRAIKHLKQEEKALTFKARMQEEYGRAVAKHSSEDLYTIATSKFGMPPFSKEVAEDNSPNGILRRQMETKRYLKSQFDAGKARYDFGKQALVKSNRKPIEDLMPKKSLSDVLGDDLPVATKASIMNAAKRKRNRVTTQGDQFAGAFEGKIGVHNPSAHRRENWSTERVAPEQAKTGSLLYNPDAKYDDKYEVFVVVDREKGLMAPIKETTWQHRTQAEDESPKERVNRARREIAKAKALSRKDMALASEYSIQDALNRHEMKDPSLKVEVMPLQLKNQRGLALW